jgi:hypothetical protein
MYPAAITAATLKLRFFCKLHDPRATESLTLKILFSDILGPRPKNSRYLHPDVRAISDAITTLHLIPYTPDITAFQASLEDARDAAFQEWITKTDTPREAKRLSLLPPDAQTSYDTFLKECRTSHDESLQMFSADKASFALRSLRRPTDTIMLQDYCRIQLVSLSGDEGLFRPFLNGLPTIRSRFDK